MFSVFWLFIPRLNCLSISRSFRCIVIHFYKIPDFFIGGFFGGFGSGKSLAMVESGIDCADYYRKSIVSNIRLNRYYVREYARKFGYDWFAKYGRVFYVPDTLELLTQRNRVILFDEVGVNLFSRNFKDRSRDDLLNAVFTLRQFRNFVIFTAQGKEQIDSQFRKRVSVLAYCRGFAKFDRFLGHHRLFTRRMFYLSQEAFEKFEELGKNKLIYPLWASNFRVHFSLCGEREQLLFQAYQSFKSVPRDQPMEIYDGSTFGTFRPHVCKIADCPICARLNAISERSGVSRPTRSIGQPRSYRPASSRNFSR